MKRILATLMLSMLFESVMAEEKASPIIPPTDSTQNQDKTTAVPPEEKPSIVDYCRTHTCYTEK